MRGCCRITRIRQAGYAAQQEAWNVESPGLNLGISQSPGLDIPRMVSTKTEQNHPGGASNMAVVFKKVPDAVMALDCLYAQCPS